MPSPDPATLLLALLCGMLGAALLLSRMTTGRPPRRAPAPGLAALLYRNGALADANAAGRDMLDRLGQPDRLDALVERLSTAYPALPRWIEGRERAGEFRPQGGVGPSLTVERLADGLRIALPADTAAPWSTGAILRVDRRAFAAIEEELTVLRAACNAMPAPVWRDGPEGQPLWRNAAARAEDLCSASFDPSEIARLAPGAGPERTRATDGRWWTLQRSQDGYVSALPAGIAVAAESAARSYAMALVETFAHLPVGLAVFASDGRLRTFNPALAEMTGLDPAALALRPTLRALLDRLRAAGLLPAGAGCEAWSGRIARIEEGTREGTFLETWELTDGRSWRVSGRPHPGGALALLIEDATTESGLSRRFKAGMAIGQAIADTIPDALAVFARGGTLVASNAAYAALWGSDPRVTLADPDAAAALSTWRGAGGDDPGWEAVAARLRSGTPEPWSFRVPGPRAPLLCTGTPGPDGATLVRFAIADPWDRSEAPGPRPGGPGSCDVAPA